MRFLVEKLSRKYGENVVWAGLPVVFGSLMGLLTLPIILKSLPARDYGVLQLVLAIQTWILILTGSHISSGMIRSITKGEKGTFIYVLLKRLKISLIIGAISFIISLPLFPRDNNLLIILFWFSILNLVFGLVVQNTFLNYFIAQKDIKKLSFWQIFINLSVVISSTLIAYFTKNIIYFFATQIVINILLTWIGIILIIKKDKLIVAYKNKQIDESVVSYGLKLIPIDIISTTASKATHFIIGPFFGFVDLAIFSIANKLKSKSSNLIRSIIPPLFYADFARKEKTNLYRIINGYLLKIGIFGFLLTVGLIFAGLVYIKFFLPNSFLGAIDYFIILSLGLPAGILSIFLHTTLESHLRYKELAVVGVLPNILKIILILIFGYFWRIIGICVALALASWISFLFYYLVTIKKDLVVEILKKHPFLEKLSQKY